jgi:hypothetical protein
MSAKYTFLAWDTPVKNAPLKLTLLQLANNADDDGFSYYSISKMALACGMSDRTFMRKIAELEELRILSVTRRSNRPSLYTLIGDEMGVTLCHLQKTEVTECHGEVTESQLVGDSVSHDLNSTPDTTPESIVIDLNIKAWELWVEFRKEAKFKKYKTDAPMKKLSKMGTFDEQLLIVQQSIDNEYQGLFPLRKSNGQHQSNGKKLSAYERARAANAEYRQEQPNEREVVVGTDDGYLGRAVDEGAGRATIEYVDSGTFIDYDQSS